MVLSWISQRPSPRKNIPHILHFMWLDKKDPKNSQYPDKYSTFIESWKKYNPKWQVVFWYNKDAERLWRLAIFSRFKEQYSKMKHIEKCDFTRYAIMHAIGGVYVDLNTICYRNIDSLVASREIILAAEPPEHYEESWPGHTLITNSFLASRAHHPFWLALMDNITENYWNKTDVAVFVLTNTGPARLGKFALEYFDSGSDAFVDTCLVQPMRSVDGKYSETSKLCLSHSDQKDKKPYCAKMWEYTAGWGDVEKYEAVTLENDRVQQETNDYSFLAWIMLILVLVYLVSNFAPKV